MSLTANNIVLNQYIEGRVRQIKSESLSSLIFGGIGLFFLPMVFGPIAIHYGRKSLRLLDGFSGPDAKSSVTMAHAGLWLGYISTVIGVIALLGMLFLGGLALVLALVVH